MKKLVFVFAIFATILVSCGSEPSVIGAWQLDSVSGEELTESEKEATMTFKEDGTCDQTRGERTRTVNWEMSEDGKSIAITDENGGEETMGDLELTEEKLSFTEGNDKITFVRK